MQTPAIRQAYGDQVTNDNITMLTTILQSCAAAVALTITVTVTAVVTLAVLKMIPNKREQVKEAEAETLRKNQLARAIMAHEKSAYQLARIADQLEKTESKK